MSLLNIISKTAALAVGAATALATTAAVADEDIAARFSWKLKGEYGFYYYGLDEGLYSDAGINLNLGEGAGSQAALGALIQGQEDVVIMPGIFAISAIKKGMPIKIVALYQPAAPIVLISHPENPVNTPKDLEGKTMATAVGETGTSYIGVLCELNDVDCDKIDMVLVDSQTRVPQFIQNKVDVVSVYRTNDLPSLEAQTGVDYPVLDLPEFGLKIPGMAVVASDEGIAERADALRAFLTATAEAIAMTREDPDAATAAIRKVWPAGPADEVIREQIEETMASVHGPEGKPVGWIEESAISNALDLLATVEEDPGNRPVSDYFTNELLQ